MKQRTIADIDAEIDALEDEMLEMNATGKEWDDCVKKRRELMQERELLQQKSSKQPVRIYFVP